MSNLTVLDRNIIAGLADDEAEAMFFRLRDGHGSLGAERLAYDWQRVRRLVARIVSERLPEDKAGSLLGFIRERFFNLVKHG